MAELSLVVEEAEAEFTSLRQLVAHSEVQTDGQYILGPQARVAAINACVLYVAAAFEEATRQLGNAYVDALATKALIPAVRLDALKAGLWERAATSLSSRPFGVRDFQPADAQKNLKILKDFCLDSSDLQLMKNNAVYNYRNMRTKEVNKVFKRLGIDDICNKVGRCAEFKAFFLVDAVSKAQDKFIAYLNDFYDIRNLATHELGTFRSQGNVDALRYVEFFDISIRRLASVLEDDLRQIT